MGTLRPEHEASVRVLSALDREPPFHHSIDARSSTQSPLVSHLLLRALYAGRLCSRMLGGWDIRQIYRLCVLCVLHDQRNTNLDLM